MDIWGNWYWPAFLCAAFVLFAPAEIFALVTNSANTLSEYCWRELHVTRALELSGHGAAWWASLVMWVIFFVVITLHIWYRGA